MNIRRKSPTHRKSRRHSSKKSNSRHRSPQSNDKRKKISGGGRKRSKKQSRSKKMTLQELHMVTQPSPKPFLYMDTIAYNVYINILEKELSSLNKILIDFAYHSRAKGGRYPTPKELYESKKSEEEKRMDEEWYRNYKHPNYEYENRYGSPDFHLTTKDDPYTDSYKKKYYP